MNKVIEKDPNVIDIPVEDYKILPPTVPSRSPNFPTKSKRDKRKIKKGKPITLFQSLSYALTQLSESKDKIFLYLEIFLNNRPKTYENLALAIACQIYADLNPHERQYTTYEEILDLVNRRTSGNYIIDPALFYSAVAGGAHMLNVQSARDVAVTNAVDIVRAMIARATKPEGGSFADSKLLLEVTGVATKEGPSVVINNQLNNQTNLTVEGESAIPKFMGKVLEQDSVLRDHYRKALKQPREDEA